MIKFKDTRPFDLNNFKRIIQTMKDHAKLTLNPKGYSLSEEATRRLKWMHIIYYETHGNVKQAAKNIGVSRQWLSAIKNNFERHKKDPRSLEPGSRAPLHTDNRKRIPRDLEKLIVDTRNDHPYGKIKLKVILKREYGIIIGSSTINKYLHQNGLINPKISGILIKANQEKKKREENKEIINNVKFRPPLFLRDYKPGAKVEKDMKLIPRLGTVHDRRYKDDFWYQQTLVDTFTRIRSLELTKDYESKTTAIALELMLKRLDFPVATLNSDGGSENQGEVDKKLKELDILHFQSRPGTPTDDPRVERSHKTDDDEFYNQGNMYKNFEEQQKALRKWEWEYNYFRPHQALGYLAPIAFYELYQKDPEACYAIVRKYRKELRKDRERLKRSRQLKNKKQVDELIQFISVKLQQTGSNLPLNLLRKTCQWCS